MVSSGGLLTNYAMTADAGRDMAVRIQSEIRRVSGKADDAPISVAFLPSDVMPISVSNVEPGAPRATGMEVLTTWPVNLITIHGLFLGVVMCLMLLPTFGRKRTLRYNRVGHFGNHLSAMATLMRRSGGVVFARQRISQYLRQVRGETSGPWVLPDPAASTNQSTSENVRVDP